MPTVSISLTSLVHHKPYADTSAVIHLPLLVTSKGVKDDWCVQVETIEDIHAVVETVYPSAVADWVSGQNGTFTPSSFQKTINRQQGMFRNLDQLTQESIDATVETVCGGCIRQATWHQNNTTTTQPTIPCAEPCKFLVKHGEGEK